MSQKQHQPSIIPGSRTESAQRLQALLAELQRRVLDGFLVPRADEHQGEYVPPHAQRLAWLTGFTGSAGLAIVYKRGSAIFVDGRYTLQVQNQVDTDLFEVQHLMEQPPKQWLAEKPQHGEKIGYDPWLHTPQEVEELAAACAQAGAEFIACDSNPLDTVWADQPEPPLAPVLPHPLQYAGESSSDKRERIGKILSDKKVDAAVITLPDSIAWLLNVRGGDVERSPLPLSFAVIHTDGHVDLFLDERKIANGLQQHLGNHVTILPPQRLGPALDELGLVGKTVQFDPKTAPAWVRERLSNAKARLVKADDPCLLPKACKNETEINGTRTAHHRDGIALARFFHWLAESSPDGNIDEIMAEQRLAQFRADSGQLKDLSFDTISGSGANGAIVHYRVSEQSNKKLAAGTLYLVDSGAQYLDGTTDVTRTVAIGQPTAEHRDRFTRVLKGHIALATARFPKGTTGSQLDILARQALWQAGLDYDHGTGHGVGSYLGVHEGPQRISKIPNTVALQPGMIVSNEPGYYKTGEYGIRIENLVTVTAAHGIEGGERPMHAFETLTLAPIDRNLVEKDLLSEAELAWLNDYHARVWNEIGPNLQDEDSRNWLQQATQPI
jgi:Xaa-Pro aminopeptidase